MNPQIIADTLPILTIFSNILIPIGIMVLVGGRIKATKRIPLVRTLLEIMAENALRFAWIVALVATLGSLFYSEVMGYTPCLLCWYQRILMYPLSVILGIAYYLRDRAVVRYVLPLSVGGSSLALYHYLLQVAPKGSIAAPCTTVGFAVSCSESFTKAYGYITIPWMSFSAFVLITVSLLFIVVKSK